MTAPRRRGRRGDIFFSFWGKGFNCATGCDYAKNGHHQLGSRRRFVVVNRSLLLVLCGLPYFSAHYRYLFLGCVVSLEV